MTRVYETEASLAVEDFLRRAGGDARDAFDLASEAAREAGETVLLEIKTELGYKRRPPRIRVRSSEFLEFDSSNITHAGAYFRVVVEGLTDDEIRRLGGGVGTDWAAVGELVREWAGSDRGSDDLARVANVDDAFWDEFRARVAQAFGGGQ